MARDSNYCIASQSETVALDNHLKVDAGPSTFICEEETEYLAATSNAKIDAGKNMWVTTGNTVRMQAVSNDTSFHFNWSSAMYLRNSNHLKPFVTVKASQTFTLTEFRHSNKMKSN